MSAGVLIAHESEPIRAVVVALLSDAGYAVTAVPDGLAARKALHSTRWDALIVDVALSGLLSFELVDEARRQQPAPRIILIASIYNRTSYKRRPTSLYGADDYIEQHHIADALCDKLAKLLHPDAAGASSQRDAAAAERVRQSAASDEGSAAPAHDNDATRRAQRLARLIVSDIALYNGEAVAAARAAGEQGMERLEARLRSDLEEGRLLFDLRVAQSVRRGRNYIDEALRELLRGALPAEGGR